MPHFRYHTDICYTLGVIRAYATLLVSYEKDLYVCRSLGALEPQMTRTRTYWIRTVSLWHKKALKLSLPLEVERINKAFETEVVY